MTAESESPQPDQLLPVLEQLLNIARFGGKELMLQALQKLSVPFSDMATKEELQQKIVEFGIGVSEKFATTAQMIMLAAEFRLLAGDTDAALQLVNAVLAKDNYPRAHLIAGNIHVRSRNLAKVHQHVTYLVKVLEHYVSKGQISHAIALHRDIYHRIGREYEDEDFVYGVMHPVHLLMDRAGQDFARGHGPFAGQLHRNKRHKIAFIFSTGAMLAHSEVTLMMCSGLAAIGEHIIEPVIFVFSDLWPEFTAAFTKCGAVVHKIPADGYQGDTLLGKMIKLRQMLEEQEIDTAVWVSVPPDGALCFGYRVAPRQVYWSMKFHTLITPNVDHLVSCGSWAQSEKTVHDRRWVIGSVAFADPLRGADLAEAVRIRAKFSRFKTLLGVLAREEKINSRPYLEAVARILEQHPEAGFIWTGRNEHPVIRDFFAARGLKDRAIWVGWVHTATYIHALDIFLETFPFGCGMTSTQALAAGKPLISYRDWTTVMGHHFAPVLERQAGDAAMQAQLRQLFTGRRGDSLFLMAENADQYVEMTGRVINDPILCDDLAQLGRLLVTRYLSNSCMAARRFGEIFREIDSGP
jgi:hypothetical protein